jgi:hypothetical protein
MIKCTRILVLVTFLISNAIFSQTLTDPRKVDWSVAGLQTTNSSANFQSIDMANFNVVGDGVTPNDTFLSNALSSIGNNESILKFPEGTFLFNNTITLPSNVVLKGVRADKTIFKVDLSSSGGHSIQATGALSSITSTLSSPATKDNNYVNVSDASNFSIGDWVKIFQNDTDLVTSTWAYNTVGQIVKISNIVGNKISLVSSLRLSCPMARAPYIKKINPVKNVGIECIKILRVDDTAPTHTSNVFFNFAVNSWVKGIESEYCTNSHVNAMNSSNLYISKSYFHDAFGHGGGGRAYGVILQATTNECLVENNSFRHLRHSMLLQSGANGNVFAYNYSTDPYWDDSATGTNSAGDMVLHGNYPYSNLFEQNICRNIVIDNSHGPNGPHNTFLRNRAEGYGIFFSSSNSPSQNFLGNDITNTSFPYRFVNYNISGLDHFIHGNNNKGTITPSGTNVLLDESYTYGSKPDFIPLTQWAAIGTPNSPGVGSIPARDRFNNSTIFNNCCTTFWTGVTDTNWNTASNWDNKLPTNDMDVSIPNGPINQPVITGTTGVTVNDLTVEPAASLIINGGGSLKVNGTSIGKITYNVAIADTNWHLVSSPVVGEQYDDAWVTANSIAISGVTGNRAISTYDNTTPSATTLHWRYFTGGSTATFSEGIGYSNLRTSAGNFSFTGTFPSGDVSPTISQNDNSWNLLGNPYPSYIDIDAFITANTSNLHGAYQAVYVWNGTSPITGSYNPLTTGYINPGQSFFVNSNLVNGTASFTEAMQSHQTGVAFYKKNNTTINLSISDGATFKETQINYLEGKTKGLDPRFDIGMFDGTYADLRVFTHLVEGSQEIAFETQALPTTNLESIIIPLGVKANVGKEITFSLKALNLPADIKVFLEDKQTNVYTRLDEDNSNYTITLNKALNGVGRFYLHTSSKTLGVSNVDLLTVSVYSVNQKIHFLGLPVGKKIITLYNILGKKILEKKTIENTTSISATNLLKGGIYLVNLKTEKGKIIHKVIIQ